jgi:hypothetical protein
VVVARGGAKAVAARAALARYGRVVAALPGQLSEAVDALVPALAAAELEWGRLPAAAGGGWREADHGRVDLKRLMQLRKHRSLTAGALAVAPQVVQWVAAACGATAAGARLFVAGDAAASGRAASFAPASSVAKPLSKLLTSCRAAARPYSLQLRQCGWPPVQTGRPGSLHTAGTARCRCCAEAHSSLWVQQGVCRRCEEEARAAGRCPFRPECGRIGCFCPHDRMCFLCDRWSCTECALTRGDGEDVLGWAEGAPPVRIASPAPLDSAASVSVCRDTGGGRARRLRSSWTSIGPSPRPRAATTHCPARIGINPIVTLQKQLPNMILNLV